MQMDIMKDQLERRDALLAEQRAMFYKALMIQKEQVFFNFNFSYFHLFTLFSLSFFLSFSLPSLFSHSNTRSSAWVIPIRQTMGMCFRLRRGWMSLFASLMLRVANSKATKKSKNGVSRL